MKIWRGLGILTPLLLVAGIGVGYFLYEFLGESVWGRSIRSLAFPAGLLLASGINYWTGRLSNGWGIETETLPDGEERVLPKPHTFLWVPMEVWSVLFVIAALVVGCVMRDQDESLPEDFGGSNEAFLAADTEAKLADPRAGDYYLFEAPADSLPYLFRVTGVTDSLLRLQSLAAEPGRMEAYTSLEALREAQGRTPPESPGSWVGRAELLEAGAAGVRLPEIDSAAVYRIVQVVRNEKGRR